MRRADGETGRRTALTAATMAGLAMAVLPVRPSARPPACDASITVPQGFCAQIVADTVGRPRHIVALPNGDLAVALEGRTGGVLILRDADGDGIMETRRKFGPRGGTGIAWRDGAIYLGLNNAVLRWRLPDGALEPVSGPDTIVSGLASGGQHAAKTIAVSSDGALYVNVGAPSNACQERDREPQSRGLDPCPILDTAGGVWRFDADRTGQTEATGHRYATGLRNVVALGIDPQGNALYGVQHGRDDLARLWPGIYPDPQAANAEKPGEEFFRLEDGGNYGWPYCYFDPDLGRKILNPEYGGDGRTVGRCDQFRAPLMAFPAHYAPEGLAFYRGSQFPAQYRGGAFIAFHGSWNRAPMPQEGYNIVFVPMRDGRPSGQWSVFADGFRGPDRNAQAQHRPMGLAVARDGSLYVSDDTGGRIYRIRYVGR